MNVSSIFMSYFMVNRYCITINVIATAMPRGEVQNVRSNAVGFPRVRSWRGDTKGGTDLDRRGA